MKPSLIVDAPSLRASPVVLSWKLKQGKVPHAWKAQQVFFSSSSFTDPSLSRSLSLFRNEVWNLKSTIHKDAIVLK